MIETSVKTMSEDVFVEHYGLWISFLSATFMYQQNSIHQLNNSILLNLIKQE